MRKLEKIEHVITLLDSGMQLALLDDGRPLRDDWLTFNRAVREMGAPKAASAYRWYQWTFVVPAGYVAVRLTTPLSWEMIDSGQVDFGVHASVHSRFKTRYSTPAYQANHRTLLFRQPAGFKFPGRELHPANDFGFKVNYLHPGDLVMVPPSRSCKWVRPLPEDLTSLSELPQVLWPREYQINSIVE